MKDKLIKYSFSVFMLFIFIINIIPIIWVFRTAFVTKESTINIFSLSLPTIETFIKIFAMAPFPTYYINTLIVITGVFSVQFFLVTLAAYAFGRMNFLGKNVLFVLFLIQLLITPDVLMLPNYVFLSSMNLIDTHLGIMIPYFASAFGIFLLRQTFKQLPNELEEAAKVEGFGLWSIIWKIYVPLSKPAYISFAIVSISYHWNNFLWPLIVTNSVQNRTLSLGLAMFAQSYETGAQWGEVCAATVAVIFPLLVLFLIFEKKIMDSFVHSGIK